MLMLGAHKPQQQATLTKEKSKITGGCFRFGFRNPREKIQNPGLFICFGSPLFRRLFVTCDVFARYYFSWLFRGFFVALICLEKQYLGVFPGFSVAFSFWANYTRTRPGKVF